MILPAEYVTEHVRLGYAATEHGYESDTVTIGINLASEATTRRGLYVAVTRGREENWIHVVTDSADVTEARDVLERVLAVDRADVPAVTQRRRLAENSTSGSRLRRRRHTGAAVTCPTGSTSSTAKSGTNFIGPNRLPQRTPSTVNASRPNSPAPATRSRASTRPPGRTGTDSFAPSGTRTTRDGNTPPPNAASMLSGSAAAEGRDATLSPPTTS